jgi:type II secretory pathway pseudopilin PulG
VEVILSASTVWHTMNGKSGSAGTLPVRQKDYRQQYTGAAAEYRLQTASGSGGFTYMTVLILIAVTGVALIGVSRSWRTIVQREMEAELLFRGSQIRKGIESYRTAGDNRYPRALSDLLKDPRSRTIKRHLRKVYPDPFSKDGKWILIRNEQGDIIGVHSGSTDRPLKVDNFSSENKKFRNKKKYSDWKFIDEASS